MTIRKATIKSVLQKEETITCRLLTEYLLGLQNGDVLVLTFSETGTHRIYWEMSIVPHGETCAAFCFLELGLMLLPIFRLQRHLPMELNNISIKQTAITG